MGDSRKYVTNGIMSNLQKDAVKKQRIIKFVL